MVQIRQSYARTYLVVATFGLIAAAAVYWFWPQPQFKVEFVPDRLKVEEFKVNGVEWSGEVVSLTAGQIVKLSGKLHAIRQPFIGDFSFKESQEYARIQQQHIENGTDSSSAAKTFFHMPGNWLWDAKECDKAAEQGVLFPTITVLYTYGQDSSECIKPGIINGMLQVAISEDGSTADFTCDSPVPDMEGHFSLNFWLQTCEGAVRKSNGFIKHAGNENVFSCPVRLVKNN